jgi:5'-methylthioadenosine phosphorylase
MRRAIIGGTGVYDAGSEVKTEQLVTAYGDVTYDVMKVEGREIIFLPRHGKKHNTPPHKINYRANMMALKMLDVTHVYATVAVGSMNDAYEPGDVVVITDFIDFTKSRVQTFFEGDDGPVAHVEMTEPYCGTLRAAFKEQAQKSGVEIKGDAVYVCTEGPRFETAAEIRMYHQMGGDVVGMTNVPESVLAKELGMCYAAVGVITNWCTGIEGKHIEGHQIAESMEKNKVKITETFIEVLKEEIDVNSCKCDRSLIVL